MSILANQRGVFGFFVRPAISHPAESQRWCVKPEHKGRARRFHRRNAGPL